MSQNDAALTLLEQVLVEALTLAHEQGDLEAAGSLTEALEKVRGRKKTGSEEGSC